MVGVYFGVIMIFLCKFLIHNFDKRFLLFILIFSIFSCGEQGDYSLSVSSSMSSSSSSSSFSSLLSSSSSSLSSSSNASNSSDVVVGSICPVNGPCRVLPFGDSITDGYKQSPGGYRMELFKKTIEAGKNITFVGGEINGPKGDIAGKPFPRQHQGHSGWTIETLGSKKGIMTLLPSPALDENPNIILLHIGTNDLKKKPSGMADRLENLIDKILDEAPNALLVVASIVPSNRSDFPNSAVLEYNAKIPEIVQSRADIGFNIIFVDQYDGFPTSELGDKLHPSPAGYTRMAGKWYDAIEPYLR